MEFAERDQTDRVLVYLEDDTPIYVEVAQTGREDVSFDAKTFQPIANSIEKIVQAVAAPIRHVSPTKASITFGLEIGVEQGSLVAVLVQGSGKANLEIALEWAKES